MDIRAENFFNPSKSVQNPKSFFCDALILKLESWKFLIEYKGGKKSVMGYNSIFFSAMRLDKGHGMISFFLVLNRFLFTNGLLDDRWLL